MRVSPRDLRGIRAEGLLTRFAVLGPVAFVSVEVPHEGSAGTGVERPSQQPAWGLVLHGSVQLNGPTERSFPAGTAFHVPAGPPDHWFTASGRAVIAGFAPMNPDVDTSNQGIRKLGFEVIARPPAPMPPPRIIQPAGGGTILRDRGQIESEVANMGDWVFMRSTFGPLSGYTSGWCDLPHWGMVLEGDLALRTEESVELLTAGDVFYVAAGPPGHQFQVPDGATTIDYTPAADLRGDGRKADWRVEAVHRLAATETDAARGGEAGAAEAIPRAAA